VTIFLENRRNAKYSTEENNLGYGTLKTERNNNQLVFLGPSIQKIIQTRSRSNTKKFQENTWTDFSSIIRLKR
jgi:hypothetical protein